MATTDVFFAIYMYAYLIRRVLLMIPTLFGVAFIIFFLMRAIPGDIAEVMLGDSGTITQEMIDTVNHELGLDRPIWEQFFKWILEMVQGDLGKSLWTGRLMTVELEQRFQVSLQVAIMATIFATMLAIPLGTIAALRQDSWIDYTVRIFSIAGLATPSFWLGLMIILFLVIFFGWSPPLKYTPIWVDPLANFSQLVWPILATGYRYSAVATRMTRSAVLEVLREDYIRTARAKGLMEKVVLTRHALKNAMLPVITVIGLEFAFLMGGLVVTEQVFNLNGLGMFFVKAVGNHDYQAVQILVMIVAFTFVMTNFLVDVLYAWLDPRIRYG